jgi:hypothetical protein
VICDTPIPEVRGSQDTDYYAGHLIAESLAPQNVPVVSAAPELLAAAQQAISECAALIGTPAGNALQAAITKATEGTP